MALLQGRPACGGVVRCPTSRTAMRSPYGAVLHAGPVQPVNRGAHFRQLDGPSASRAVAAAATSTRSNTQLYLLHWNDQQVQAVPRESTNAALSSTDFVETLQKQVKAMEKVAKKAVWFTTAAAGDGHQHVLMVTDDTKVALKYDLTPLPKAEDYSVPLPGDKTVTIPVAAILAARAKKEDESSDSDDEVIAPAAVIIDKKAGKDKDKEEEKKKDKKKDKMEGKMDKVKAEKKVTDDKDSESGSESDEDAMVPTGAQMTVPAPVQTITAVDKKGKDESDSSGSDSDESGSESGEDDCIVAPGKKAMVKA